MKTKKYIPTKDEVNALFEIAPFLNDAICINESYFNDKETSEIQRDLIRDAVKNIYQSCLNISENNALLPFC